MTIQWIDKIRIFFSKRELIYVVGHIEMSASKNGLPVMVVVKGSIIGVSLSSSDVKSSLNFIYTDHPTEHAASYWRVLRALDSSHGMSTAYSTCGYLKASFGSSPLAIKDLIK